MKNFEENSFNAHFTHIYVETQVFAHERTKKILSHFPNAQIVEIGHYKDVFNRKKQNYIKQHEHMSLILAATPQNHIYPGAKVCQSFGNDYFYYTSCIMNCLYDCEYCYLKGMYPSGNMVMFVDLETTFAELEKLLEQHPVYLCVSYDTDLIACEGLTGFVEKWVEFVEKHENLRIEIRTKCGNTGLLKRLPANPRVIFAYTISPEQIAYKYEHGASSAKARIAAAALAQQQGLSVRLCFDPMIYCPQWKKAYKELIEQTFAAIDAQKILDVSVGSFRISQDYLKKMRRQESQSAMVQFPFANVDGVYQYPDFILEEMETFMVEQLTNYVSKDQIFQWK